MRIINALKAKFFAREVEITAQAGVEMYVGVLQAVLNPLPALAGDLAQIIVLNQSEIERSILLAKKIYSEVSLVLEEHAHRVEAENENVKALTETFMLKLKELRAMIK